MLKTSYNTESEIPENLKGAYIGRDGKFVLDQLSDDHPVIISKKAALADKANATQKVEGLEADLAQAKTTSIPRGHIAVPKADADLLEKLKPHGTPQEIETKLSEHKELQEKVAKQERDAQLREVAKILSYEPEAFVRLQSLPEFEIRDGADNKKTVIAKLKDSKGVITEKPAQEFIESSADIAPFLPALKATGNGGTKVFGSRSNDGSPGKSEFDKARDVGKAHNESRKQATSITERFGIRTPA